VTAPAGGCIPYGGGMKRIRTAVLIVAAVVVAAGRLEKARKAYVAEVAAGSKPIEAVGTSIAAFVGLDPP